MTTCSVGKLCRISRAEGTYKVGTRVAHWDRSAGNGNYLLHKLK